MTKNIRKILIANRGEIAARIIRTCHRMGIHSIAVYSDVDRDLDFVKMADESVCLGAPLASESYLNISKLVQICQDYDVDAVHPGYGFLSENADFAEALHQHQILFIGPSPQAIRTMGSKSEAKHLAEQLNIPIIQGYQGKDQSSSYLEEEAIKIGFPLLIKAIHGGGGKGMRRVDALENFQTSLSACQREAQNAFANDSVMLEKYIVNPRHIEVQIFGDSHGNVIALAERDCSLQRRHQKIIEEAPAAGLPVPLLHQLHQHAIALAKAVHYTGAGTVEFLVDQDYQFYFLEMNTRLQVEHPVTEMILGLDLVEWQIQVARGESLPLLEAPCSTGHAIEARLYAEDPSQEFLPSTGVIQQFETPFQGPSQRKYRLDAGYKKGNKVTIYYDPLLAKLIIHAPTRQQAYHDLAKTLGELVIDGVKTNREFLIRLCHDPEIVDKFPSISYLDHFMEKFLQPPEISSEILLLLGLEWFNHLGLSVDTINNDSSPWDQRDGWRQGGFHHQSVEFCVFEKTYRLFREGNKWFLNDHSFIIKELWQTSEEVGCILEDVSSTESSVSYTLKAERVMSPKGFLSLLYKGKLFSSQAPKENFEDELTVTDYAPLNAPMPGRVISVLATAGQAVDQGSPLVILEAMKMEHTIRAPYQGIVEEIFFSSGDFVEEGMELARMKAA